nr:MAG TPA: hypothetical protein [Caudoviricetes sp.]
MQGDTFFVQRETPGDFSPPPACRDVLARST